MARTRREFTPEYEDEALKLVVNTGRAVATLARELGINTAPLGWWVAAFTVRHDQDYRRMIASPDQGWERSGAAIEEGPAHGSGPTTNSRSCTTPTRIGRARTRSACWSTTAATSRTSLRTRSVDRCSAVPTASGAPVVSPFQFWCSRGHSECLPCRQNGNRRLDWTLDLRAAGAMEHRRHP